MMMVYSKEDSQSTHRLFAYRIVTTMWSPFDYIYKWKQANKLKSHLFSAVCVSYQCQCRAQCTPKCITHTFREEIPGTKKLPVSLYNTTFRYQIEINNALCSSSSIESVACHNSLFLTHVARQYFVYLS